MTIRNHEALAAHHAIVRFIAKRDAANSWLSDDQRQRAFALKGSLYQAAYWPHEVGDERQRAEVAEALKNFRALVPVDDQGEDECRQ